MSNVLCKSFLTIAKVPSVEKFNPYHDHLGRFTTAGDASTSQSAESSNTNPGRMFFTPYGVEVIQNPTNEEYRRKYREVSEQIPDLQPGEPRIRSTYDASGNEYIWSAYDAMHSSVEPYINERYNTKTSQQSDWWKRQRTNKSIPIVDKREKENMAYTFLTILKSSLTDIEKFNPYHDAHGRFTFADGASSMTWKPGQGAAYDKAITREKERTAAMSGGGSSDGTITDNEDPVKVSSEYYNSSHRYTQTVLEAVSKGNGEISLDYAKPSNVENLNRNTTRYDYELKSGLYQRSNSSGISESVNIDWDKVQRISGNTYDASRFLERKGFTYDKDSKSYVRPKEAVASGGKLTLGGGDRLPSNLNGINEISGNTYQFKDQIKSAGFKWNSAGKNWVRKSDRNTFLDIVRNR